MAPFRSNLSSSNAIKSSRMGILARGAAALTFAGAMTLSAIAGGNNAVAQAESAGLVPATITPADAIVYIGIDLDIESPQWTLADELLTRAGSEETGSDIIGDVSEDATGADVPDVEAFVGGEAAFVVTSLEGLGEEAGGLTDVIGAASVPSIALDEVDDAAAAGGFAIVLQPSDIASVEQQLQEELTATEGVEVTETDYNGTTIYSAPANDVTGDSAYAFAVVGDFVVLAELSADVEPFIDTAAGTEESLADVESFNQASDALDGDRLAFGFIDSTSIEDDLSALEAEGIDLGSTFSELEGAAGYTGMSVIADPAGFRFETVVIPVDGAAETAAPSTGGSDFAEQVPGETLAMATGYDLGQTAFLQGIGLVFITALNQGLSGGSFDEDSATPVPVPSADELYAQAAQLLGFNIKTDFIDQMTGEYGFAIWGTDFDDPSQVGAILTSGVDQPATLADTLSKLSFLIQAGAQGEANVTTRAVGDYNINTVTVPQEGADPIVVEYGIVDGQFVLGYGNGVDALLDETDESLADNADYQAAMAELPADYDGVFYLSIPQIVAIDAAQSAADDVAFVDDPELCGEYSTQAAAQEAYDADPVANFEMDWDFDGIACESFFDAATPVATPVASTPDSPVRAFAGVSYTEDGLARSSSILIIEE